MMAKRRAEETVLFDSPSKRRHFPAIYSVDVQLGSMALVRSPSPQSLLTVLGSRCRKRPPHFDNEDADSCERIAHSDSGKHAKDVLTEPFSGSFQDGGTSYALSRNKRAREDRVDSDIVIATDKTAEDSTDEDAMYNSFQHWRVPLPDLDLSLLEDIRDHSLKKDEPKSSDTTADAMET